MKLKKIAALALAGVMAVSMLAGCAGKGEANSDSTTETAGVTAKAVVDALNADTDIADSKISIKFTATDDLTKAVDILKTKYGTEGYLTELEKGATTLAAVLPNVYTTTNLGTSAPVLSNKQSVEDAAKTTVGTYYLGGSSLNVTAGANDETVVKQLVEAVKGWVCKTNVLPTQTDAKKIDSVNTRVEFDYDAKLSLYVTYSEVGVPTYYVAWTVARTGNTVTQNSSWS